MLKYVCVCVHMPSKFLSLENQIIFIKIFQATIIICNHGKKKNIWDKYGICPRLKLIPGVSNIWFHSYKGICLFFNPLSSLFYFLQWSSLMRYNTLLFSCVCMNVMPVIPPKYQIFYFLTLNKTIYGIQELLKHKWH